jgi:hypothetical protein
MQAQTPPLEGTELSLHVIVVMLKRFATVHISTPCAAFSEHLLLSLTQAGFDGLIDFASNRADGRSGFDASDTDWLQLAGARNAFFSTKRRGPTRFRGGMLVAAIAEGEGPEGTGFYNSLSHHKLQPIQSTASGFGMLFALVLAVRNEIGTNEQC